MESGIQNPESGIRNTESRTRNPQSGIKQRGFSAIAWLQPGFEFLVSGFGFQFGLAPVASEFTVSGFQRASCPIAAPAWIPVYGFRFLVADPDLDLLRSLLILCFAVSGRIFV